MFDDRHYVPILKGKQAEYFSLRDLETQIKEKLTPVIEVPPIDWDFDEGRPKRTIDEQVSGVAGKLNDAWGSDRAMFVELGLVADAGLLANGSHPIDQVFEGLRAHGTPAIPVTGLDRPGSFQAGVERVVRADDRGVCLRLVDRDFEDVIDLQTSLDTMMVQLGVDPAKCDVIIDLREIPVGQANTMALAARGILYALPYTADWRTVTVAGTAFPENLTGFQSASASATERTEWLLWKALVSHGTLNRTPTFGDYAIAHPDIPQIDPRFMRMSAQLRYTVENDWLIFKERNVRDHGFDQFNDICRDLVARPEYSGRDYSWGDTYADDCARNRDGPGNATTWRRVATTHHLTYVVNQITSLP